MGLGHGDSPSPSPFLSNTVDQDGSTPIEPNGLIEGPFRSLNESAYGGATPAASLKDQQAEILHPNMRR
jgi:hypothetical protein